MTARRFSRLVLKATKLRPALVWLRHRGLCSSDVFIASYPRSGSTWLRFLLFEILTGQSAEFESVSSAIPYIGKHSAAPKLLPGGGRLIKTHEPYCTVYRKAIYLVRDARDIVISEHSYQRMRSLYSREFDCFLADFLEGSVHGFGSWGDHIESWLHSDLARNGNLHVVKFEEMREDTEEVLARILSFVGVAVDSEVIRRVIRNNSVERMREKEDRARQTMFRRFKPDLRFVNRGSAGGWRAKLTGDQVARMEQYAGETLIQLGYQTSHLKRH